MYLNRKNCLQWKSLFSDTYDEELRKKLKNTADLYSQGCFLAWKAPAARNKKTGDASESDLISDPVTKQTHCEVDMVLN